MFTIDFTEKLNMENFLTTDESSEFKCYLISYQKLNDVNLGCRSYSMNLIFALGVSKTMNIESFNYAKNVIQNISSIVDPTKHQLGVLQFSGRTKQVHARGKYFFLQKIKKTIKFSYFVSSKS